MKPATFDRSDLMRTLVLSPYSKGDGPRFRLRMYYLGGTNVGYDFLQGKEVLFSGSDYRPSPLHAIDSDDSAILLLAFLTVRPGDTDDEYFAGYTPEQLAFCEEHAENVWYEVASRYGKKGREL